LPADNIFVEYYLQGFPGNWHGNTQQRKIVCIIADLAELLTELPPGPRSTFHTQHPWFLAMTMQKQHTDQTCNTHSNLH
jgi:hypothetical protein